MTTDASRCVIDTNILIYSTVAESPWHDESRQWLSSLRQTNVTLCVTNQILREYMVVLTRGAVFETVYSIEEVLHVVEILLQSLEVLGEPGQVAVLLRDLVCRYEVRGKQIHDANIVAVMEYHGVSRLATFNQVDFKRYQDIALEPLPSTNDAS